MSGARSLPVLLAQAVLHAALAWASGCGLPELPEGVECSDAQIVSDAAAARDALSNTAAGECVLLSEGSYATRFQVPSGVTLAAEVGARVSIAGDGAGEILVALASASVLVDVDVTGGNRHGVVVEGASAKLLRVLAFENGASGISVRCSGPDCLHGAAATTLSRVEIRRCGYGLSVEGAYVRMQESVVSGSFAGAVAAGAGAYVFGAGHLDAEASVFEDNVHGIVVSGAGTKARLLNAVVRKNGERGIWAQGLRGTEGDPALVVEGAATQIVENLIAGIGARDSTGISVNGGEIARTRLFRVAVNATDYADVADGIALFEGSADVHVAGVRLLHNERTQALIDEAGTGIRFDPSNTVTATAGQQLIVLQRSTVAVEIPPRDRSAAQGNLPFTAPELRMPSL